MTHRILVIEDNVDLASLLKLHLTDASYAVDVVNEGAGGLNTALAGQFDFLILDLMLPGMDGLEICRRVRAQKPYLPILMLTSKSSEIDRVVGLEMGADDYLVKPFSFPELIARVKAILRRVEAVNNTTNEPGQKPLYAGDLVIDFAKHKVTRDGQIVELTAKEFELLAFLVKNRGRVYSRLQLLDQVWGYGHDGYEHTVNSHINRLRAKIEKYPEKPSYVLTVWGVGYKFTETPES